MWTFQNVISESLNHAFKHHLTQLNNDDELVQIECYSSSWSNCAKQCLITMVNVEPMNVLPI
jgi:hypothetical protein